LRRYHRDARPHGGENQTPANDNDPVKAEYLRLAKAQELVRGSAHRHLIKGVSLARDSRFFVYSPVFQEETRCDRKTVRNSMERLGEIGFIRKLEERKRNFPLFQLTPLEAWYHLVPKCRPPIPHHWETASHKMGNGTPHNMNDSDEEKTSSELTHQFGGFQNSSSAAATAAHGTSAVLREVRAAFVAAFSEEAAISWIDPCGWCAEDRTLVAQHHPAWDFLRRDGAAILKSFGVQLVRAERLR
jgi:hypothetical protein